LPGIGKEVQLGQLVKVHYIISIEGMDDILESTYKGNRPRRYRVGQYEVLPILEIAMQNMRIGETSKFLGISDTAFGKMGVPYDDNIFIPAGKYFILVCNSLAIVLSLDFLNKDYFHLQPA